ncbi:MAG: ABC transporter permease, partial [Cyclobacteriaceae bacterium]|nr:ABC transporter permease [Cyclobacteriaceae bacterium]
MILHFLMAAFRGIRQHFHFVLVNIIGLGLSLACCIVAYLNYEYASKFDRNHKNFRQIYKIQVNKLVQGQLVPFGITPLALGKAIEGQFSDIGFSSRYNAARLVVKKGQKTLNKQIGFADEAFFSIFSFPFLYGDASSFSSSGTVLLSEETAGIYFGDVNPVGQLLTVITHDEERHTFMVGGVLKKIPQNSSLQFDALLPFDRFHEMEKRDHQDWADFVAGTFIMTDQEKFPEHFVKTLNDRYVAIQNAARDDWRVDNYFLEPLATLGVNGAELRSNWLNQAPPKSAVIVPVIMAFLILLIACFNFTNTAIAISFRRLKEIGIRKVMGGSRSQLMIQFMAENLVLSALAMFVAMGIAWFLVPSYNAMWDFIDIKLQLRQNPELYLFLGGLLVVTSVFAGGYPSWHISSYQPVTILKGNFRVGASSVFTKSLLTAQYTLTAIALIGSLAFYQNASYQSSLDLGFEKENILAVSVKNRSEYVRFTEKVRALPQLEDLAATSNHIGSWTYGRTLRNGTHEAECNMMDFGMDYARLMGVEILEGRYFEEKLQAHDRAHSLIVNEQLVREFGWENPLGQRLQLNDTTRLEVIGVMKDLHMWGFWDKVAPLAVRLANEDQINFVVLKTDGNANKALYSQVEDLWHEVAPNSPFYANYQEEFLEGTAIVNANIMKMFGFLGILALILSTIGLYTLVSLSVIRRTKEIGVRKVLGSGLLQILMLINRPF